MSSKRKVVVFAPHPDDETFGCGGTIAKKISEGHEVYVVVMTDGRYAFRNVLDIEENPTPEQLKEVRMEEIKKAVKILGVQEDHLIFLDFIDGSLKDNEKDAEKEVFKVLGEVCPEEVYLPYRLDGHPDHSSTFKIVKKAIAELGISPVCYEYSITHKFARIGRFIDPILEFLFGYRKVAVDISKFLKLKELAIMEFKSELEVISILQPNAVIGNPEKYIRNPEFFYVEKRCCKKR